MASYCDMVSATLELTGTHIPLKYTRSWAKPRDPTLLKFTDLKEQHKFICHSFLPCRTLTLLSLSLFQSSSS